MAEAIRTMQVRGAPLIGASAAYGMALAMASDSGDANLAAASALLAATRPTAVNLRWALEEMRVHLAPVLPPQRAAAAYARAGEIAEADVAVNRALAGMAAADRGGLGTARPRGPREYSDPLQCRLARRGGLGHRSGADLSGP